MKPFKGQFGKGMSQGLQSCKQEKRGVNGILKFRGVECYRPSMVNLNDAICRRGREGDGKFSDGDERVW